MCYGPQMILRREEYRAVPWQNGGGITVRKGGGERWYSKRGGSRTATNEAFVQCNIKARGR